MAFRYPNLAAEIARNDLSYEEVYSVAAKSVGKTVDTVSNWMSGRAGELPVTAAFAVRDAYFPDTSVDYLFNAKPIA